MNQLPRIDLTQAMAATDEAELDETAQAIAQVAVQAVGQRSVPYKMADEEERLRLSDAALGDVVEMVARHRQRLGRRVCSISDARTIRMAHELLRAMADASGGLDNDPSFQ